MTEYPSYDYLAEVDAPDPTTPCKRANCGWDGAFSARGAFGDCGLTPVDPSPAGRSPERDVLGYVAKDEPADSDCRCDGCDEATAATIGRPDGSEICRNCFDQGQG